MNTRVYNFFQPYACILSVCLCISASSALATPTIVDSINEQQLAGIATNNITSLAVQDGTLWITDGSNLVHQWQYGKAPSVFQTGSDKQRFSSLVPVSDNQFVLVDTRNSHYLVSHDKGWHIFADAGDKEGELDHPTAAAWSRHGIIYIADTGNDRISAFTKEGLFLFTFGNNEPEATQDLNLKNIVDIATDRIGRVFVLDETGGGRISIYSPLGELDTTLGKDEMRTLYPESMRITAITVRPDGVIIMADKKSGHIFELDWENMEILSSFGTNGKGRGQFRYVTSLALDGDGKLYVADKGNKKIEVFQTDWKQTPWVNLNADKVSVRPSSVLLSPCEVSYIYDAEHMLCINSSKDKVSLRTHDGKIVQTLDASFDNPIRAVFDQDEIFVLDSNGVKVFDHQGVFKFAFGSKGRRSGDIRDVSSLALTAHAIYIADTGNKRVQVFSRKGLFQKSIGNDKNQTPTLEEPTAVAIGSLGDIYVADNALHLVLVYSPQGKLIDKLGFPEEHPFNFQHIYDITTAKDNVLYVMTALQDNPLSIWVYKDNKFNYRFSPTAQEPTAGFDQQWGKSDSKAAVSSVDELVNTAKQALNSTVQFTLDMTLNPVAELFTGSSSFFGGHDAWLFNRIPNKPFSVAVLDTGKHARHTFLIAFPPRQVRGVVIGGDEQQAELHWLAESNDFDGFYTVYGREDIASPFQIIQKTIAPALTLQRKDFPAVEYRISASTPLGREGKLSPVYQDTFWIGYQAFQAQRYEQALNALSEATLTNPKHAAAWLYLGKTQMAQGSFDEAVNAFRRLAAFDGWKQKSIHLQAQALIAKEAWLDVKALVDAAESEGNVDAYLYSLSAQALTQMDDVPSAIYYLSQAVKLEPTASIWHLKLADANFKLGAEKDAKAELLTATQLAGQNSEAWLEIARTYAKYQLNDDAIVAYERVLAIAPQHTEALPELAALHLKQHNLADAKSLATRMSAIPALKGTSYYILGQVALAEDKAPLALAMLAKAGQANPENADIWLAMANAYAKLGKPEKETEFLKKANAADAHNFDVHMRLAQACMANKDALCSKTHYEQATSIDTQHIQAQLGLARANIALGKMVEADKHARKALRIDPSSIEAHLVLAEVQSARGMIPASIATLKKALKLDDTNMNVYLALSKAYIDNHMYDEAIAITDKAMLLDVRNPAPLMLSGSIYLARQSFDKAIAAFEKAVELAPDNAKYRLQLNTAYLQKKRANDAGGNMVGLKLHAPQFSRVFAAAYKQYTDTPVAKLKISNEAGVDYTNVKLSLFVKGYMDFPTSTVVERIPANGEVEVPLLAAFSNRILDIDEDTGVQTEIRAEYYLAGKPHADTRTETMTIYGKNAIVWSQLDMVGSFTTPKDDTLAVFVRQLVNAYAPKGGAVNPRVTKAMTIYDGFSAYGITYLPDPNTPYAKLENTQIDTVQFPRETLRQRSGDCDDLSVLLAASFANLGIETAILDVPQHLLMMFNTGVPASRSASISLNDDALAIIDGEVWIPLEATLIASSFNEAWAEGARKYHLYQQQGKLHIMPLEHAWKNYPPVTLPPAAFALTIPDANQVGTKIKDEWKRLLVKALERQVRPYRIMLALDETNLQAQMQIAVVYARNGLYDEAVKELERIRQKAPDHVAALNNLGNIHYLQQDYQQALSMYQQAAANAPNNADIKVNMAMAYYKMGDVLKAKAVFDEATQLDDQVPNRYHQLAFLLHQ